MRDDADFVERAKLNDMQTYAILLRGQIDPQEISAASPLRLKVESSDSHNTKLQVWTDQSGIIGLLRFLHGRGLVILSMKRKHDKEKQ